MQRHWKKFVAALVAVVVLVLGASFIYAKFINKADPEFNQSDVDRRLAEAAATTDVSTDVEVLDTAVTAASDPATPDQTAVATQSTVAGAQNSPNDVDGTWTIKAGSEVGYRVKESINGFDTEANGRTQAITGTFLAAGTTVTEGQWTVDMTTFQSDESRRDAQFDGRIMDIAQFPTSTFVLTAPIDFGAVPEEGGTVTATATGDLMLHGTTNPVTFEVQATFQGGLVGVLGQIPIVFADYGIPAPSFGTVTTEDNGLLEFVLVMERA